MNRTDNITAAHPINDVIAAHRTVFVTMAAVALIVEFVVGSAAGMSAAGKEPIPLPLSIAVVGGSYTAGIQNQVVWPTLLAERTGWSVSNFAQPDSGFVADGQGGHSFTHQVDRAQGAHPQVILIVGGLADTGYAYTDPVTAGAADAMNKVQVAGQQVFMIGPTWYETSVPEAATRVSAVLQKVAEGLEVPYLDALDPPWLTRAQMSSDLRGPTDAGQSVIADKIATWLRSEVAE